MRETSTSSSRRDAGFGDIASRLSPIFAINSSDSICCLVVAMDLHPYEMIDFPMEVVMILAWRLRPAHQAGNTPQLFFTTQAGGCGHSACGAAAPTRESEVASPSAPLSSQQRLPSRSLRSARRQPDERRERALGIRLLRVRLTEQEAEQVARRAKARGLSLSDFVRRAVLRGTGARFSTRRCVLAAEDAATIRQLTDIAAGIRSLTAIALAQGNIDENELRKCLTEVSSTLARLSV